MADDPQDEVVEEVKPGVSILTLIIVLAVMTVIGGGAGAGVGFVLGPMLKAEESEDKQDDKAKAEEEAEIPNYSGTQFIQVLPPIVTNLAQPPKTFVRLESSFLFEKPQETDPTILAEQLSGDFVAYLRTVSLEWLEGPSAIHHLREDLLELAKSRTGGNAQEVIIKSLVVE